MPRCVHCSAETALYVLGEPVCVDCDGSAKQITAEFTNATQEYSRLSSELMSRRGIMSKTAYLEKLAALDEAQDRCDKARRAIRAMVVEKRNKDDAKQAQTP